MDLPEQRWLRAVVTATVVVFVTQAVLLYGTRFFAWVESDASVAVLLAARTLRERVPVLPDWYYANGDIWLLAPHLFALLPVAIGGVGRATLLVSVTLGLALEIILLARVFRKVAGASWIAVFASIVTLTAWSPAHVAYIYVQLAYGLTTVLCAIAFGHFAIRLDARDDSQSFVRSWAWPAVFLFLFVAQNPTRAGAFVVAPLVVACCWPWREVPLRRRVAAVAVAVSTSVLGSVVYSRVLSRFVTFAFPKGHNDFAVRDLAGMKENVALLAKGIALLGGGREDLTLRSAPGIALLALALLCIAREVVGSRALTPPRFLAVVLAAQLVGLLLLLVTGNLVLSSHSARYVMPTFMLALGLTVVLAVRDVRAAGWTRRGAIAWLALLPISALVALPSSTPPTPAIGGWPHADELAQLAPELERRGLTRGFSSVLNANIMNLESRGTQRTCPIFFAHVLIPHRWLADADCFTPSKLPERFYVLADRNEHDERPLRATLPAPLERFSVGDTYVVSVYATKQVPLAWLALPIRDAELATFPMQIAATHLALHRRNVVQVDDRMLATGEPGFVVHGPYLRMPKGDYDVRWRGSAVDSPGEITFVVASDFGRTIHDRLTISSADVPRAPAEVAHLSFSLAKTANAFELHVLSAGGARIALDEVVITRR